MSVFKNIFNSGIFNLFSNIKPSTNNYGQIYMKSDKLLYFLNADGNEYLLSANLILNTIDFLLAQRQNPLSVSTSPVFIPWDTGITVLDNVSINTNTTIINIGTAGVYNIKYTIHVECTNNTANGSNPNLTSYIVLNGDDGNEFRRYASNTESIITYENNYRYAQTVQCIANVTSNSNIKLNFLQTTGSSNTTLSSTTKTKMARLNVQRIFPSIIVGDYLSARHITQQTLTSASPYDIMWDTVNSQYGNISVNGALNSQIDINSSGYYNVTYNITFTGDSQDVTGTPELESYIVVNNTDNTSTYRYGVNKEIVVSNNGDILYFMTISAIIKLAGGDNLRFRVKQTTGSNTIRFSGVNDSSSDGAYKISNLDIYKMDNSTSIILNQQSGIILANNTTTAITWSDQIDVNGDLTQGTPTSKIEIATTGTYDVVYTLELNNTDNSITGNDPRIESYIAIDGLTNDHRYGNNYKSIVVDNGNMKYSCVKACQIEITAGSYIELYVNQITGSSNITASSTNLNQMMSISVVKTR